MSTPSPKTSYECTFADINRAHMSPEDMCRVFAHGACYNSGDIFNYYDILYCKLEGNAIIFITLLEAWLALYFTWSNFIRKKFLLQPVDNMMYKIKIPTAVCDLTIIPITYAFISLVNSIVVGVEDQDPTFAIASTFGGNLFFMTFVMGVAIIYTDNDSQFHKEYLWTHGMFLLIGTIVVVYFLINGEVNYIDVVVILLTYISMVAYSWIKDIWNKATKVHQGLKDKKEALLYRIKMQHTLDLDLTQIQEEDDDAKPNQNQDESNDQQDGDEEGEEEGDDDEGNTSNSNSSDNEGSSLEPQEEEDDNLKDGNDQDHDDTFNEEEAQKISGKQSRKSVKSSVSSKYKTRRQRKRQKMRQLISEAQDKLDHKLDVQGLGTGQVNSKDIFALNRLAGLNSALTSFVNKTNWERFVFIVELPISVMSYITVLPTIDSEYQRTRAYMWPIPGIWFISYFLDTKNTVDINFLTALPFMIFTYILFLFTLESGKPPSYNILMNIAGLLSGFCWTYFLGNEAYKIVKTLSVVYNLDINLMTLSLISVASNVPYATSTISFAMKYKRAPNNFSFQVVPLLFNLGFTFMIQIWANGPAKVNIFNNELFSELGNQIYFMIAMQTVVLIFILCYSSYRNYKQDHILGYLLVISYFIFVVKILERIIAKAISHNSA